MRLGIAIVIAFAAIGVLVMQARRVVATPAVATNTVPLPASKIPTPQEIFSSTTAPTTQDRIAQMFLILKTQDLTQVVFTGPTTQPSDEPQR